MIYRRFYGNVSQDALKQLYLSLVRPHLEYGCQVWNPHLVKDREALENVQKFACRIATVHWDENYETLLQFLDIQPLQNAEYMPGLDYCIESSTSYHIFQKALSNYGIIFYLVEIHTNLSSKSLLLAQILTFTPLYHTPLPCGIPYLKML